ncbi:MAG: TlpA family protein disulfide reductase [Tannerella sp.]|nr:TlpA family protein disulfide reductase [Tannerella sp.]
MKKRIVFICLALIIIGCKEQRPAVIERPAFESWSSTSVEVEKIELNDTATVMRFRAYFPAGNWIRISGESYLRESGTDNRWMISGSEGIGLDEEFYMPESGEATFSLIFPSLPPNITKIDFTEGDCDGCFIINGIRLLPGEKVDIASLPAETAADALPPLVFSDQPATLSGQFYGYVKGTEKEVSVYLTNVLTDESQTIKLSVADDGTFGGEVNTGFPGIVQTSLGNVFLTPGKETKIFVDKNKQARFQAHLRTDKQPGDSAYTSIAGSPLTFSETENIFLIGREILSGLTVTKDLKPADYKALLIDYMNNKLDEIGKSDLSPNAQQLSEIAVRSRIMELLMNYQGMIRSAFIRENNIRSQKEYDTFNPVFENPDSDYYDFIGDFISPSTIYVNFKGSLDAVLNSRYFGNEFDKSKSPDENYATFKAKADVLLGADNAVFYDIVKAGYYANQLNDMKFYTDAEKNELKSAFASTNPAYANALIAESDELQKTVKDLNNSKDIVMNDIPDVPDDKLLDAIVEKYRGKVVLVDFWATWCGPCMSAMESIKPLKEEMKDKVVFVYLTGETSPLGAWNKAIPAIHGEHYRVSAKQWSYLCNKYDVPGIPAYMIFDKKGKNILHKIGFPGNDALKEAIEKG